MLDNPAQQDGVTALNAKFYNSVAEELENAIEASGQTLETDPPSNQQLIDAIKRLAGNAAWQANIDYLAGSQTLGSDGELYRCVVDTGPTFANASDPVTDNTGVWTSPTKRYTTTIPFDGNGAWTTITNGVIQLVRFGDTVTMTAYADLTEGPPSNGLLSSQTIPDGYRPNLTDIYIRNDRSTEQKLALPQQSSPDQMYVNSSFEVRELTGWDAIGGVINPVGILSWQSKDFIQ